MLLHTKLIKDQCNIILGKYMGTLDYEAARALAYQWHEGNKQEVLKVCYNNTLLLLTVASYLSEMESAELTKCWLSRYRQSNSTVSQKEFKKSIAESLPLKTSKARILIFLHTGFLQTEKMGLFSLEFRILMVWRDEAMAERARKRGLLRSLFSRIRTPQT